MRRTTTLVLALLLGPTALLQVWAGVPETINVQGRLTDASGTPLPPGFKQFDFSIYTAETGGILRWGAETQFIATDAEGLWTASVGSVEPIT